MGGRSAAPAKLEHDVKARARAMELSDVSRLSRLVAWRSTMQAVIDEMSVVEFEADDEQLQDVANEVSSGCLVARIGLEKLERKAGMSDE